MDWNAEREAKYFRLLEEASEKGVGVGGRDDSLCRWSGCGVSGEERRSGLSSSTDSEKSRWGDFWKDGQIKNLFCVWMIILIICWVYQRKSASLLLENQWQPPSLSLQRRCLFQRLSNFGCHPHSPAPLTWQRRLQAEGSCWESARPGDTRPRLRLWKARSQHKGMLLENQIYSKFEGKPVFSQNKKKHK